MREIFFLRNHTQNVVEKLFPDPFLKNEIEDIPGSIFTCFIYFIVIVCQVGDYQNWLKLSWRPPWFISNIAFLKNKKGSRTSHPASFSAWFLKKSICLAILFYLTKFQYLIAFTSWDLGQYVYCNSLLTRLWHNKFWN